MSAALTHAAMGLLLGLALRLRWRDLPLAALLAELPDLDHLGLFLPVPVLVSRGTLHNLFVCVVLPAGLAAWMRWRDVAPRWQRLALAAPLLLTSHLLLDMLPLDPLGGVGNVLLLYPLSPTPYTLDFQAAAYLSPATYSTITLMLLLLAGLAALTLWVAERRGLRPLAALAGAWLLVLPAAGLAGAIVPAPAYPNALLSVEAPRLRLPEGSILALVHNLGGTGLGAGALRLDVRDAHGLVVSASNPKGLAPGETWIVDLPVPGDARALGALTATLAHARTGHAYAAAKLAVERGHLDLALRLDAGSGPLQVVARNDGGLPAPAGSLRATATQNGRIVQNLTNDQPLPAGGSWTLPPAGSLGGALATWDLRSADDGTLYDRRAT